MDTITQIRCIWKPTVFLLCLVPAALIVGDALEISGRLGANPIEEIQDRFGIWALRFIMIALAVTPLRQIAGWNWLARFRRMLGLFAFFYVLMHFLVWLILDQSLLLSAIGEDVFKRPFITLGMLALLLLLAMAATSTTGMRRRLGRRWQTLHNSVYIVAILGVWHYWWQVKLDTREPMIYAAILAVLLGCRVWRYRRNAMTSRPFAMLLIAAVVFAGCASSASPTTGPPARELCPAGEAMVCHGQMASKLKRYDPQFCACQSLSNIQ